MKLCGPITFLMRCIVLMLANGGTTTVKCRGILRLCMMPLWLLSLAVCMSFGLMVATPVPATYPTRCRCSLDLSRFPELLMLLSFTRLTHGLEAMQATGMWLCSPCPCRLVLRTKVNLQVGLKYDMLGVVLTMTGFGLPRNVRHVVYVCLVRVAA